MSQDQPTPRPGRRDGQYKIAWLINDNEGYGIRRALITLSTDLKRLGCGVRALAIHDGPTAAAVREAGLDVEPLGLEPIRGYDGSFFAKLGMYLRTRGQVGNNARRIAEALRAGGDDVLHVLSGQILPTAARASTLAGVTCVWEMPNLVGDRYPFDLNRRLYQRLIVRHRVLVLADSEFTAATVAGRGAEPKVNYHATDVEQFDPDRVVPVGREELGLPTEQVVFGQFSRLTEEKGHHLIVEALAKLPATLGEPHSLQVGGPMNDAYHARLVRTIAEHRLQDRVHLLPLVSEVERHLPAVDVALSCRINAEPFGLSVIEAMLMRRPVIAHSLGGPGETIVDGETGWLFHEPTADALAQAMTRALNDRDRWPAMGEAERARALAHFAGNVLAERYLRFLDEHRAATG